VTTAPAAPLLAIAGLRVTFRDRAGAARAVDGVDLVVAQGETVGLVGESGSGKSVTAYAVLRLVEPDGHIGLGSSVRLEGRDLLALPAREMRAVRGNHVALMVQEPGSAFNPVRTIGSQIAEAVRAHHQVSRRAAREKAVEMLALVGLPDPAERAKGYAHQLSGGQRQRALLAMALACGPRLLIADEPTTALDVTIQAEILELLRDLQERLGMAVLLITHNLGVVAGWTRRTYVMYAGQIVEEAPTAALFTRPAHPYTEGLLAAVPRLDERKERLASIPGQIPPATAWPSGCRFHPRCPFAWDRCRVETPPLLDVAEGHRARCWLVAEPERREPGTGGQGTGSSGRRTEGSR